MAKSSIRSLRVQASQSVDIAFNMPGVIAWQNYDHAAQTGPAFLGQRVNKFDLDTQVYPLLGTPDAGDEGMLQYGSTGLRTLLRPNSLFVMRNAGLGASLDQMLQQRRGAFRDKFKHKNAIQAQMSAFVPRMITHLNDMRAAALKRFQDIDAAYGAGGVVKTNSTRTTAPVTTSRTQVNPVTTISSAIDDATNLPIPEPIKTEVFDMNAGEPGKHVQRQKTPRTLGVPATLQAGVWQPASAPFDTQLVETTAGGPQEMITDLQAFAHPKLENVFGFNQAMVTMLPELLRQETTKLKLNDIAEIMASELAAIDLEIRNLQLNYVHTHLTAPIEGLVTGIFKDIGETVEPGEPVLRVENDTVILIVGRVQNQGPIWIGRTAQIELKSIFEDGSAATLTGPVVAIRGHEADNDEWEIIVRCTNPVMGGRPILPLNYHFDPDTDVFKVL